MSLRPIVLIQAAHLRGRSASPGATYGLMAVLVTFGLSGLAYGWLLGSERLTVGFVDRALGSRRAGFAAVEAAALLAIAILRWVDLAEARQLEGYRTCLALGADGRFVFRAFHLTRVALQLYLPLLLLGAALSPRGLDRGTESLAASLHVLASSVAVWAAGFAAAGAHALGGPLAGGRVARRDLGAGLSAALLAAGVVAFALDTPRALAAALSLVAAAVGVGAAARFQRREAAYRVFLGGPAGRFPGEARMGLRSVVRPVLPANVYGAALAGACGLFPFLGAWFGASEAAVVPALQAVTSTLGGVAAVSLASVETESAWPAMLWWLSGRSLTGWFLRKAGLLLAAAGLPVALLLLAEPGIGSVPEAICAVLVTVGAFGHVAACRLKYGAAVADRNLRWKGVGQVLVMGAVLCVPSAVAILNGTLSPPERWGVVLLAAAFALSPLLSIRQLPAANPRIV